MTTPYRDEDEALRSRYSALENEVTSLRERRDKLEEATRELNDKEEELANARKNLSRKLPLLERARVASPCKEPWDNMVGDEKVRFCGRCEKKVYNVIAMSRTEAETLLAKRDDTGLCMRLFRRQDGTVLTEDCPVGMKRRRNRNIIAVAALTGFGLASAGATMVCTVQGEVSVDDMDDHQMTVGVMVVDPMPETSAEADQSHDDGSDGERGDEENQRDR